VEVAQVGTRKQREKDAADVRHWLTVLAACAGVWAWAGAKSIFLGVLVFIIALVIIEALLLGPGILRRRRLRSLGYDPVLAMNGEEFEEYLQAFFQGGGYRAVLTPNGADFGADLVLERGRERTVVQAKHWVKRDVGVSAVQEVHAAKAHYKADHAMVVTVGSFTKQAVDLAKSCKVELWDGRRLQQEVLHRAPAARACAPDPVRPQAMTTSVAAERAPEVPKCPRCGRVMVRRASRYGDFWGCSGFPACTGKRRS
jgi:restriction system protein